MSHKSYFKVPTFRSEAWRRAVVDIGFCVLCGGSEAIQAAHRNLGKGMGIKNSDSLCACLCQRCHVEIDQGKTLNRDERRAEMDRAIVLTLEQLVLAGRVGLLK